MDDRMGKHQDSSSSGASDGKFKLQVEAKACPIKVDATRPDWHSVRTPVMVSITALTGTTERASPVDLVVVLHISEGYNVPRNWKKLLAEAVHIVVKNLDHKDDRLAVLPAQSTLMSRWDEASAAAGKYLEGITSNISLMRALETAESILYGRQHTDINKIRPGYIIVISNSNDDIDSLLPWRFPSVHAFGFRDAHNARTLQCVSGNRDCTYAVLDDEHGQITQAFLVSVDRITSPVTAMQVVEVKLSCDQKVLLSAIDTPGIRYIISHDKKLGLVWPSAQLAGVATNFIVYVDNLQHHDLHKLFKVHVKYSNVPDREIPTGVHGSEEVAAELMRIQAFKLVTSIISTDQNDWEKLHAAADNLPRNELKSSSDHSREAGLSAVIQEMQIRLYNNYFWLEHMLTWQSHQRWQLPLPEQFMDNRSSRDPLLRLEIFGKPDVVPVKGGFPVLVRVTAPEGGLAKVKRASIDLIVVLDVSYGAKEMEEKAEARLKLLGRAKEINEELNDARPRETRKRPDMAIEMNKLRERATEMLNDLRKLKVDTKKRLNLLTKAMELVTKKLSVRDRLAIIPVQSSSTTAPTNGLLEISNSQGRSEASNKVKSIVDHVVKRLLAAWPSADDDDDEGTQVLLPDKRPRFCKTSHWREQSKKAMKLLTNCLHIRPNMSTPTMMSGGSQNTAAFPTHTMAGDGHGSSQMHKAWLDAVQILENHKGEDRQGFIMVISDGDDDSICKETLSPNYITHAFGFCDKHNTSAMYHIASSTNGIYDTLNDYHNRITAAFTACINKITSAISADTKVEISCSHSSSVALSTVDQSSQFRYSISNDRKSSSMLIGSLSAGTVKNFIVYLHNVRGDDYDNFSKLFKVHVKWRHAFSRVEEKLEGQVVVVRDAADDGFKEVEKKIAHGEAVKIASLITDSNYYELMTEDKLKQMCTKCRDFAHSAGEDRLAWLFFSVEEEKRMEGGAQGGFDYYRNRVANKRADILSWLSYQRSREQEPTLPLVA